MAADRVRDEAERLVAAAIAAVSYATRGFGGRQGAGLATGSPECCVCPVCRTIAALRDPAPELAERLATGVGDLAAGLASLLRNLQRPGGRDPEPEPEQSEGDAFWESLRRKAADAAKAAAAATASTVERETSTVDDDPWRAATTAPAPTPRPAPAPVKKMAKKSVKARATGASQQVPAGDAPTAGRSVPARKATARKATGRKATGRAQEKPA